MKHFITTLLIALIMPAIAAAQGKGQAKRVLFFGDSITAGYGISTKQAFPALIQEKIDSLGWKVEVINAGLSGETSAGGLRRIDWVLRRPVDVFVLELGGNDGLRGINLSSTKENLQGIIDKVREKYPEAEIVITGMQVPPNLGPEYTSEFKSMYPDLAKKNNAVLIPFLLDEVGGYPDKMQNDGLHPNIQGHKIIAKTIWDTLKPLLKPIKQ